ncbi:MAG: hypothetical protein H6899_08605 [Rhodobacter sp.]|nr:hypothetical protein [Paracoccaceae bacterium]MCB1410728.1 hypothetical protein [Paracoccaceae bacterium]MCC0079988.1 hypothetical protein [Rhodobacter sp.]
MRPFLLPLLALCATPALADEVWTTPMGPVAWETDLGANAVLRLDQPDGRVVRLIVPGLATDVMGGRGSYTGVWVSSRGDEACATEMVDPLGGKSPYWGTFTLTFVHDAFPSDWAGVYGSCLDTPDRPVAGVAQVGGE